MTSSGGTPHTLVVYRPSSSADATLQRLADSGSAPGRRLTVIKLVAQESEARRCCDTRSVLWNEISRDLGREDLARATAAVNGNEAVRMEAVLFSGRRAADAVVSELLARDADEVVLAGAPLGRLARRRLRRISPVPVREPA
jgi:hypothetical protein